jgi:hypothetical protein
VSIGGFVGTATQTVGLRFRELGLLDGLSMVVNGAYVTLRGGFELGAFVSLCADDLTLGGSFDLLLRSGGVLRSGYLGRGLLCGLLVAAAVASWAAAKRRLAPSVLASLTNVSACAASTSASAAAALALLRSVACVCSSWPSAVNESLPTTAPATSFTLPLTESIRLLRAWPAWSLFLMCLLLECR